MCKIHYNEHTTNIHTCFYMLFCMCRIQNVSLSKQVCYVKLIIEHISLKENWMLLAPHKISNYFSSFTKIKIVKSKVIPSLINTLIILWIQFTPNTINVTNFNAIHLSCNKSFIYRLHEWLNFINSLHCSTDTKIIASVSRFRLCDTSRSQHCFWYLNWVVNKFSFWYINHKRFGTVKLKLINL